MSPVRVPRLRRVLRRTVLTVALVLTILTVALTVSMFVDDATIDASKVQTVATVLVVSPLRTGIEFVDATGVTVRPSSGVLYPGNLQVGLQFKVEYAASDPSIVRVAGRSARNALISITMMLAGTWLVAGLVVLGTARPSASVRRSRDVSVKVVG